jgi:anti-anti-sigma regulatory factor
MSTIETAIQLNGDIDLSSATAERERVLALLEQAPPVCFDIDIVGEPVTQPALQLFFATVREVRERGHEVAFGERAAREVARIAPRTA